MSQHVELLRCQGDHLATQADLTGGGVDAELVEGEHRGANRCARAAQHAAHPSHQLARREGFHHVVVGPELQTDHTIGLIGARREQDDRHGVAQFTQHVEAGAARQHHVEHHEVGMELRDRRCDLVPIAHFADHVPVALEIARHDVTNRWFVVDHEHPLNCHVRTIRSHISWWTPFGAEFRGCFQPRPVNETSDGHRGQRHLVIPKRHHLGQQRSIA